MGEMKNRVLVAALLLMLAGPVSAGAPGFVLGVSQGSDQAVPVMAELGIEWGRVSIAWKDLYPEIEKPFPQLSEVFGNALAVEHFSRGADWSEVDRRLRLRLDNGITPIPIVGSGWHSSYPMYKGKKAHPEAIGEDHYLAFVYLCTRASVERYDGDGYMDAPGIVIKVWQTENELNQAGLTAGWGWRDPTWLKGLNSCWNDWDFLTRLMELLYQAAHHADPEAITYMNFHTDIHPRLNRMLRQPDWETAVVRWKDYMDIIGFDAYPNYYTPEPVRGDLVAERARRIAELAPGKKVWVIETDYPYAPLLRGFTPEKQAEFLRESYESCRAAGVDGYFKFRVVDDRAFAVDITERDLENLEKVVPLYQEGRVWRLLLWALPRAYYVKNHFLDVMKSVEGNWGVVGHDGKELPAYAVLESMVEENDRR